jgi:uncharacterized RDD family membrane protein YckC
MSRPGRREQTRPLELVGLSAVFGIVTLVVVLMTTRDLVLALIFGGIAFIIALVIFAMLALIVPSGANNVRKPFDDPSDDDEPRGH